MARKTGTVASVLQSDGFKEVITYLEINHPVKKGLGAVSTMEQRALYQIRVQEYEHILGMMRGLVVSSKTGKIESTYEEPKK